MIIKSLQYDNLGIARAIIVGDSGKEYITCADSELCRSWCTCPSYIFSKEGKSCKHIIHLINNLEYDKMVKKKLNFIATGCNKVDELLGGGVPYGIVTSIYGEPTAGKSLFGHQVGLANIAETGNNTILIETEGLRTYDVRAIQYKFMDRWGLDKKTVDDKYKVIHTMGDIQLKSYQKMFQLFGYIVTDEISKNGKYTLKFTNCTPKLKEKELEETSMIIIDSFTKPVKDSVGSNTQNLPSRAELMQRLYGKLYDIAARYNIAVVVNHHASINPVMPFGRDLGKPYGGNPVLYNSKYALEFIDAPKKLQTETGWGNETRRIKLLRRPDVPQDDQLYPVRLKKDFGFCDE